MHMWKGEDITVHYNGDFSGDVQLDIGHTDSFAVSIEDLIGFVAEIVRCKKIAQLEQASNNELFGLSDDYNK